MSHRRRPHGDSLDLLLDTVCSMFGAITLIAILVALLARTGNATSEVQQASGDMLQRKVALAESDIEALRRARAQMRPRAQDSIAESLAEKKRLLAAVDAERKKREATDTQLVAEVADQNADFGAESKKLVAELKAVERRQAEVANATASEAQNTVRLRNRANELSTLNEREKQAQVVNLRLPMERTKTKKMFPVVCKFGKVYPLFDGKRRKNESSVVWQAAKNGETSMPVESSGWSPDRDSAELADWQRGVDGSQYYIAYFVYPDSLATFRAIRGRAVAAGFDVGFELIPAQEILFWSDTGTVPPPL